MMMPCTPSRARWNQGEFKPRRVESYIDKIKLKKPPIIIYLFCNFTIVEPYIKKVFNCIQTLIKFISSCVTL